MRVGVSPSSRGVRVGAVWIAVELRSKITNDRRRRAESGYGFMAYAQGRLGRTRGGLSEFRLPTHTIAADIALASRRLQPKTNAAPALVSEAKAFWAAAPQAVRRANRRSGIGATAFIPSASAPWFRTSVRKSRTSAMTMRDDLGNVRTV
jgi:hypothetical protein